MDVHRILNVDSQRNFNFFIFCYNKNTHEERRIRKNKND